MKGFVGNIVGKVTETVQDGVGKVTETLKDGIEKHQHRVEEKERGAKRCLICWEKCEGFFGHSELDDHLMHECANNPKYKRELSSFEPSRLIICSPCTDTTYSRSCLGKGCEGFWVVWQSELASLESRITSSQSSINSKESRISSNASRANSNPDERYSLFEENRRLEREIKDLKDTIRSTENELEQKETCQRCGSTEYQQESELIIRSFNPESLDDINRFFKEELTLLDFKSLKRAKSSDEVEFNNPDKAFGFLSNNSSFAIKLKGKEWPTVQHYFQAQKFAETEHEEQIRLANSPEEAKKIGRNKKLPLRGDWEAVREEVMEEALRDKFTQHSDLAEKLVKTRSAKLIYDDRGDKYWGIGLLGKGESRLGELLMEIRENLKESN